MDYFEDFESIACRNFRMSFDTISSLNSTYYLSLDSSDVYTDAQLRSLTMTPSTNNGVQGSSFFFLNFPSVCIVCVTLSTADDRSASGSIAADSAAMYAHAIRSTDSFDNFWLWL